MNWDLTQLTIGSDGLSKASRVVDFNSELEKHLREMLHRARSDYLFPSPQRGDKDVPAKTFKVAQPGPQGGWPANRFDLRHYYLFLRDGRRRL